MENTKPGRGVLVIGDALMDHQYWVKRIPTPGEDVVIQSFTENTGGSAANSAIGLSWLGVPCAFYGCLGPDENGNRIQKLMDKVGLDTRLIQRSGSTGFVLSIIDESGERTMFSYRGASASSEFTPTLQEAIGEAAVVLVTGYMLASDTQAPFALEVARQAKAAGTLVAFDASPRIGYAPEEVRREAFSLCDIFFPNRDELAAAAGVDSWEEGLSVLAGQVPCIGVKLGGHGALLQTAPGFLPGEAGRDGLRLEVPTERVEPLDTTGAGDAFNAGFLAAFLQRLPPRKWLEAGNWLAGRVIATRGATGLYKNEPCHPAGAGLPPEG